MVFNPYIHQSAPLPSGPLPDDIDLDELAHRRHADPFHGCLETLQNIFRAHENENAGESLYENIGVSRATATRLNTSNGVSENHLIG